MSLQNFLDTLAPVLASPRAGGPALVEGRVLDVSGAGMRFVIPDWDEGKHVFGPAPWTITPTAPSSGARALVLFLGGGIENPWVLGWWPS